MKKQVLYIVLLFSINIFAQAPQSFNYQNVIRDSNTNILSNQNVDLQFIIHQNSATGLAVYTETWSEITNAHGLVNIRIGQGTTIDDFSTIDWASGPYFLETLIDLTEANHYTSIEVSQLISTPYALHAEQVTNDAVNDADTDPINEIQNLSNSSSGTNRTLNITDGTGTTFSIADNDNDSSNEIQNLSRTINGTNRTINITGGGSGTTFHIRDNDNDSSNEIQNLSSSADQTLRTLNITGGTGVTFNIGDLDNNSSNEVQTMTLINGTVLNLNQGGGNVDLDNLNFNHTSGFSATESVIDANNGTGWESVTTAGETIQGSGWYLVMVSFRCKIQGGSGDDLLNFRVAAVGNTGLEVSSNGTGLLENIKDHRGEYGYIDFHRLINITQSGQYTFRLQLSKAETDDDIYFNDFSISSIKLKN